MRKIFLLCALCASVMMANAAIPGGLPGKFSVAAGKQVVFSQGNLQYRAEDGLGYDSWKFAEDQWATVGASNEYISATYTGWIDLFAWGTGDNPTSTSTDNGNYASFEEWGINVISNGGDASGFWRTLSSEEWNYLLLERDNAFKLFGLGTVNGVHGFILLPDEWNLPSGRSFVPAENYSLEDKGTWWNNPSGDNFSKNSYGTLEWADMEEAGAVFFPVTGKRSETTFGLEEYGMYWSSTPKSDNTNYAHYFQFSASEAANPTNSWNRSEGRAVRLVADDIEPIDEVSLTVEFPKAGDEVDGSEFYWSATGGPATITIPGSAHYRMQLYWFDSPSGMPIFDTEFAENTEYRLCISLYNNTGYYFNLPTASELINGAAPGIISQNILNKQYYVTFTTGSIPTAIDETATDVKAVKRFRNGQLLIEKNGKFYNTVGAEVK